MVYLLFFCSGVSGLIYQVVWVRAFGNVLGNTIYSASLVIAVFMLGLGVGSYGVGTWADRRYGVRPDSLLRVFGAFELAIGVMQAARARGLRIPEDLAIVGYDNMEYSAHLSPRLTTIAQSPHTIGSAACRMLVDILNGRQAEENKILIPVKLVIRDSCGSGISPIKPARRARDEQPTFVPPPAV